MSYSRITYSDLENIHTTRRRDTQTGYMGVYECTDSEHSRKRFYSKCWKRRVGPYRATAMEAAADVVAWWQALFGDKWSIAYRNRRDRSWSIVRVQADRYPLVIYDGERVTRGEVGYRLTVTVCGIREILSPRIGAVFSSIPLAQKYLDDWALKRFGKFHSIMVPGRKFPGNSGVFSSRTRSDNHGNRFPGQRGRPS